MGRRCGQLAGESLGDWPPGAVHHFHRSYGKVVGWNAGANAKMIQTAARKFLRFWSPVLGATLSLFPPLESTDAQALRVNAELQATTAEIRPFKAHVPNCILIDLSRRLAEAKWPDQLPGTNSEYGVDIKKVLELTTYWQKQYNWRAQEARINHFNQYKLRIERANPGPRRYSSQFPLRFRKNTSHCQSGSLS